MELNYCHQAAIQYPHHRLPQHLHQDYPTEVPVNLWDKNAGLPGALLRKVNLHRRQNESYRQLSSRGQGWRALILLPLLGRTGGVLTSPWVVLQTCY